MQRSISRAIKDEHDIRRLSVLLAKREKPCTVTISSGLPRTSPQNRITHKWFAEAAEQLGDRTPNDIRAISKLQVGVPILRAENEAFRTSYDEHVRGLPYETKLALMVEPFDFPVTRLMTKAQHSRFITELHRYWSTQGVILTNWKDEDVAQSK